MVYHHCFLHYKIPESPDKEDTMAAIAAVKEIFEAVPHIRKIGEKHLWFDFDYEADVLYVSLERLQRATGTDILEDGVFLDFEMKK